MDTDHYGVWLFQAPTPLDNPRIWQETATGLPAPTVFSRAIGIRAVPESGLDYRGYFGELSAPKPSLPSLLAELFDHHVVSVEPLAGAAETAEALQSATGYAVITADRIGQSSVPDLATIVAIALIRREHVP
jgi:hypothetical protein